MENSKHNPEASYQPFHMEKPYSVPSIAPNKQRIAALSGVHPEAGKTTTEKGEQIAQVANQMAQDKRDFAEHETEQGEN